MPAAEATKMLRVHQWREGDVALLQAAAARLGVQVPGAPGDAEGEGLAVVSAGPGALPDASATQNHLGATVATAAPPTVSYLARAAGGRLLGSLDHQ
jgi:hypothetical protein